MDTFHLSSRSASTSCCALALLYATLSPSCRAARRVFSSCLYLRHTSTAINFALYVVLFIFFTTIYCVFYVSLVALQRVILMLLCPHPRQFLLTGSLCKCPGLGLLGSLRTRCADLTADYPSQLLQAVFAHEPPQAAAGLNQVSLSSSHPSGISSMTDCKRCSMTTRGRCRRSSTAARRTPLSKLCISR